MDDQKTASSSYIIQFYKDVQTLKYHYATYVNLLQELEAKYPTDEARTKMTEFEGQTLIQTSQNLKGYVHSIDLDYQHLKIALGNKLKKDANSPDLDKLYKEINKLAIPDRIKVKEYIIGLFSILFQDIFKKMLETSEEFINKIYAQNATTK